MRMALLLLLGAWIGGCSSTLETGYKPRALGAGSSERRAYYAQPFSPEAQGRQKDDQDAFGARRPGAN